MRRTTDPLACAIPLAVAIAVGGCSSSAGASYFAPVNPVTVAGPSHVGVQSLLGIADIQAHPGDTVVLDDAQAIGVTTGAIAPFVLKMSETHGGIGGIEGDTFGDGLSFAKYAKPLKGFEFVTSDGEIEIVFRVTSTSAGRVAFSAVDLSFRVNGGSEQTQRIPTQGAVCFGNPPPTSCH